MAERSFLPEDYVEKRKQHRTNVLVVVLFLVVMGAIGGAFYVKDAERDSVRREQAEVNKEFAQAAMDLEKLEALQKEKESMIRKAKITAVLLERVPRTLIMSECVNRMPSSTSLIEFELTTKAVRASGPATAMARARQDKAASSDADVPAITPVETTLELTGLAPTDHEVADFMKALGRSPLIANRTLVYSRQEMIEETPVQRFKIKIILDQDVDVTQIEPKKVARELLQNPMGETVKVGPPAVPRPPSSLSSARSSSFTPQH